MTVRYLVLSIILVVVTGALNNVVGKIKSKPLGRYNVLVAFLNAIIYTIAYGLVLIGQRYKHAGEKLLTNQERSFLKSTSLQISPEAEVELTEPLISKKSSQLTPKQPSNALRMWWQRNMMFKWFIFIGLMEAIGSIMGLMAQSMITGPLYSLSLQSIIVFSAILGYYALDTKYTRGQVVAMGLVMSGACVSLLSQYNPFLDHGTQLRVYHEMVTIDDIPISSDLLEHSKGRLGLSSSQSFFTVALYATIGAFSTLPTACSYASKEHLFRQYSTLFPRYTLSIFTVGFLSSLMATCFLPVALLAQFYFTERDDNPAQELARGASCLIGRTPPGADTDCTWAPIAYLTYILINVCFNFSLLHLVKISSSLVTFLSMKTVLPVAILIFATVPLPLLEESDQDVSPLVLVGLGLVISGLALYQKAR